jgi:hypothetical protein
MRRPWRGCLATGLALSIAFDAGAQSISAPPEHRRGEEQTYLTYPEWFLVHSPAEFAAFVRSEPTSEFPFLGHVGQLWSSYAAVTRATGDAHLAFNAGYHVMIMVIAVSTTVEYALRSAYETIAGRLAELTFGNRRTEEDAFAARIAENYVDFIRVRPWYEYDFLSKLKALWRDTSLFGPGFVRKWERKYALTTEYAIKALYGWAIEKATKASYEEALPVTALVVDQLPEQTTLPNTEIKLLAKLEDGAALIIVPRYAAFKSHALALSRQAANFREIAGNGESASILLSVLVPTGWNIPTDGARVVFAQPILTRPGTERVAFVVPVRSLGELLRRLDADRIDIEHIYDY